MRIKNYIRMNLVATVLVLLFLGFGFGCGAAAPEPQAADDQAPQQPAAQQEPAVQPEASAPEEPAQEASAAPTAVPESASAPVEVTEPEGTINVGQKEIGRFIAHPSQQQNPQIFVVGTPPITEGLLHYSPDREVVSKLAESWEISEDAKTWTFNLRKGVQFHKGYGEMTAEDVLYSYRQWPLSKHPRAGGLADFWDHPEGSVETPDPHTLIAHLATPVADVVGYRMFISPGGGATWVVSKKQSEELGVDAASQDIAATGPWEIVEHQTNEFWRMEAVEAHYRQTPHFAELIFREIPEESARLAGFQTGQLDTFLMSFDSIPLVESVEGARILSVPNAIEARLRFYGNWYPIPDVEARPGYDAELPWVSPNPDFNSPEWDRARKVRLALVTAIDRQAILDTILAGYGHIETPLGNYSGFEYMLEGRDWPEPNPDRARELLAEAGYPDGFSMTLTPSLRGAPAEVESCEVVAQMWGDIGIDVNFQRIPYTTLRPQLVSRTYQGATCHAGSPILTPSYGYGSYLSDNPFNRGVEHPWLEEKMREAMAEVDPEKRGALEREIGAFIFDNVLTDMELYTIDAVWPVGPRLDDQAWRENVTPNDIRNINGYEYIQHRQQ
jgi:peptide/nickel transport system substrate-binding protein